MSARRIASSEILDPSSRVRARVEWEAAKLGELSVDAKVEAKVECVAAREEE